MNYIQIPVEFCNEFLLDMLEVFHSNIDIANDEDKKQAIQALYFFGGVHYNNYRRFVTHLIIPPQETQKWH